MSTRLLVHCARSLHSQPIHSLGNSQPLVVSTVCLTLAVMLRSRSMHVPSVLALRASAIALHGSRRHTVPTQRPLQLASAIFPHHVTRRIRQDVVCCLTVRRLEMWRSQAGYKTQQAQEEEEDDWETDPDFVVRVEWRSGVEVECGLSRCLSGLLLRVCVNSVR